MFIATLLLCFFLNLLNHGDIRIGILNTLLLFLAIYFYIKFSNQKIPFLTILIGSIPLFTIKNDVLIITLAIGISLLCIGYTNSKFRKYIIPVIIIYVLFASFFSNGLVIPPFSIQNHLLIFNDNWNNLYIEQMKTESQYMPDIIRYLIFNPSVYIYVMLSKLIGLFTIKNFYSVLLLVNIYPLIKGLVLDFKSWDKSKTLLILCVFLISASMTVSRSIDLIKINTFILLSPFLIYFILRGLNSVNKKIYLALFIISIFIATSP